MVSSFATELEDTDATLDTEVEAIVAELDDANEIAGHCSEYNDVVVKLDPTMPKLELNVVGAASRNVYHPVLTLSKWEHPT